MYITFVILQTEMLEIYWTIAVHQELAVNKIVDNYFLYNRLLSIIKVMGVVLE